MPRWSTQPMSGKPWSPPALAPVSRMFPLLVLVLSHTIKVSLTTSHSSIVDDHGADFGRLRGRAF
jgi:hypothetical protein